MAPALPPRAPEDDEDNDNWKHYARAVFLGVVLWVLLLILLLLAPPTPTQVVLALFPSSSTQVPPHPGRRALRGGGNAFVPVTSPNGGQVIGVVPWPQTRRPGDQATHAEYASQSNALLSNAVAGQANRDHVMQDRLYNRMPLYAKLQAQAEDPALVASLQAGFQSPVFQQLGNQVGDPSFQTNLQSQLYRAAPRYVRMEKVVQDPQFLTDIQGQTYRAHFRPGPNNVPALSAQATAVETASVPARLKKGGGAGLPAHVP